MSVYTVVNTEELSRFLSQYNQGRLLNHEGISSGIENTNYFVTTDKAELVLTVFEQLTSDELPFFLDLTAYLAEHNIPCAHPAADKNGRYLDTIKNKPAALVQRLKGASVEHPTAQHCQALGNVLARMHLAGQSFPSQRKNKRGPAWWRSTTTKLCSCLSDPEMELLQHELQAQDACHHSDLPRGIIHADLFRDNVLFEGVNLSGLIDFYYACTDALIYDLAVTVNDWCSNADGSLNGELAYALLNAYQAQRSLSNNEHQAWTIMLRAAALRFWLSRLNDMHFPRPGEITHTKNPDVFKRILLHRRQHEKSLLDLLRTTDSVDNNSAQL